MLDRAGRLWVIHISNDDRVAALARERKFICIGWTALGDLTSLDTPAKLKAAMHRTWPEWTNHRIGKDAGQVHRFAHEAADGDAVLYPVKNSQDVWVGELAGSYRFASDDLGIGQTDYCNVRPVRWVAKVVRDRFEEELRAKFGKPGTFYEIKGDGLAEVRRLLTGALASRDRNRTPALD